MGMENFSAHQQKIIKRYYENFDQIQVQKLSEQVTELYLAERKKKAKMWAAVATTMQKIGIPQARIDHIVAEQDPKLVANLVTELQKS